MPTDQLRAALKEIGACAKAIAAEAPAPLTPPHAELQIGVGTCSDWVAWASRLRSLDFGSSIKRGSPRAKSYLEATRFTYAWTAANALFSRDQVLARISAGQLPNGELNRFRVLFDAASLPQSHEAAYLAPLHATLGSVRKPKTFPWAPLPEVRLIDLIYHKYTPDLYKTKGATAKAIRAVVVEGKAITSLDLPTIMYATRNWMLHGALLDSSFRGSPKQFQLYMTSVTQGLAEVLGRFAAALRATI